MTTPSRHKLTFATPLPQSPRSDILEWQFPKPHHQLTLIGRSRAAWHTSFIIPQLNLLLDAGLVINRLRPKHIFLTHGHSDHTLLAPAFVKRDDPPDVYCPEEMRRAFDNYVLAKTVLNAGGVFGVQDAEARGLEVNDDEDAGAEGGGGGGGGDDLGRSAAEMAWLGTHKTYGVRHGDVVPLRRLKNITATVFDCDHNVPSVGYVFSTTSQRLKPQYASLPGPELKALRESGTDITAPHTTPIFAFLGDGTASTLASSPSWLQEGIPVVITECSFLREEHRAQAEKTKHTMWADLEPVVRRWPRTTFVLTHFSLRYADGEVVRFFREMEDVPRNIVVWADGDEEGKRDALRAMAAC